jgi:hypothetical protein
MPTCMPTRPVASTSAHSANATPWPQSAPLPLDARRCLLIHTADAPLNASAELTAIPFLPQSAASAHPEQLSIPILLPR